MNPILLEPQTDTGSQLIVRGKVDRNTTARDYYKLKGELLPVAIDSFDRLEGNADLVVVEGAGSPAEVNLRQGDIANMGIAVPTQTPVIPGRGYRTGWCDRQPGGNLASSRCGGTRSHRRLHHQQVPGDPSLFDGGLKRISQETGLRSFGVLPWFGDARHLPAEDALALGRYGETRDDNQIRIAIPVFSRVANFDDLDPLAAEADVSLVMVQPGEAIPSDADLILLTGSKSTRGDLSLLYEQGWDIDIRAHVRRGKPVLGLCAGYQMPGRSWSRIRMVLRAHPEKAMVLVCSTLKRARRSENAAPWARRTFEAAFRSLGMKCISATPTVRIQPGRC